MQKFIHTEYVRFGVGAYAWRTTIDVASVIMDITPAVGAVRIRRVSNNYHTGLAQGIRNVVS
jgi:hypothetical protein